MREITINQNDAGQRLDKFLTKYLVNMPQSMLYKSLRKNCVRVNGKHIKDGKYKLQNGDVLKLFFKDEFYESKSSFKAGNSDIDVVYEDENIILINKIIHTISLFLKHLGIVYVVLLIKSCSQLNHYNNFFAMFCGINQCFYYL